MKIESITPQMTPALKRLLADVERDIENGCNLTAAFGSGVDMDTYLDSP